MKNSLIEMSNALLNLEVTVDKASTMCEDVKEGYFSSAEPEDFLLKAYYNETGIKTNIAMDYLCKAKEEIEILHKLLDKEFEAAKKTA